MFYERVVDQRGTNLPRFTTVNSILTVEVVPQNPKPIYEIRTGWSS